MSTVMIDLPTETYKRLQYQAHRVGKPPEIFMRDVLESALQVSEQASPITTRDILATMGRIRPLSQMLRRKIIPGVTLEEARAALTRANDPPLSELILEQRG